MSDISTKELRLLAAKIATSYVQANPVASDHLTGIIRVAYQGLRHCITPPPAPAVTARNRRRGRATSA